MQPKKILYVVETFVDQKKALENAITLAKKYRSTLTLLSVVPESYLLVDYRLPKDGSISSDYKNMILQEERKKVDELTKEYKKQINFDIKIAVGEKFIEAIKEVLENSFDMVVKPSEESSWLEKHFGSGDMHLLRKCPVPVLIVKNNSNNQYKNILASIDFDLFPDQTTNRDLNRKIKDLSSSFAQTFKGKLHVVHGWEPALEKLMRRYGTSLITDSVIAIEDEKAKREEAMGEFQKDFEDIPYLDCTFDVERKPTIEAISNALDTYEIDLVVMGTVGRTGIEGYFMGNTAEAILNQLECSVLAVKPTQFLSPIDTTSIKRTNFDSIINTQ